MFGNCRDLRLQSESAFRLHAGIGDSHARKTLKTGSEPRTLFERCEKDTGRSKLNELEQFTATLRSSTPEWIIAIRLGLACLFGGIIGLERELKERDAGLRTHMLTALGACAFTLVSWEIFEQVRQYQMEAGGGTGGVAGDPIRVVEAVTAGAGFLAAGIIFQHRGKVQGLTTGAGVWTAAAIGVACGSGAYAIAAVTTLLVVVVLAIITLVKEKTGLD